MKKTVRTLIVLVVMLVVIPCEVVVAEAVHQDGITWFIGTYGYMLPESTAKQISTTFEPVTFDCGDVQVTLEEILYDGVWMYTSAILEPTFSEKVLIMPDDAEITLPVSGTYGENLRDDSRTFAEAAIEDGKQIVRVMAVPREFYEVDYFICASRQDASDTSTMVCATPCFWGDEVVNLSFHVDIAVIDPVSEESVENVIYDFPITIKRLGDIETMKYRTVKKSNELAYDTITLIKTSLTTYAFVENEGTIFSAPINVLDMSGIPFASGVPADGMTTLELSSLPLQLAVITKEGQTFLFSSEQILNEEKE